MLRNTVITLCLILACYACNDSGENPMFTDNFDRAEMLEFWADDIIIPAYTAYTENLNGLEQGATNFFMDASVENLTELRSKWLDAYLAWQEVEMFEIGMAEEIGLRNYTNIYPTNTDLINANITSQDYNLELPSNFTAQGFPALDYLLFGLADNDEEILTALAATDTQVYMQALIDRLISLSTAVLDDWNQFYRTEFISNSGSSGTASTDKMVNDFLFYYERFFRAAKVGIPAGIFSGSTEADLVEGKYADIYSKQLFEKSFTAIQDFFRGTSFDNSQQGSSLENYLQDLQATNATEQNYAAEILAQWASAENALEDVNASFATQVIEDNTKVLALYDELQKAVPLLKVDMLSALNIQVDFVDADGD